MRLQLWHLAVLLVPVLVALALYGIVRTAARQGARRATKDAQER